jgi:hypothetical protein
VALKAQSAALPMTSGPQDCTIANGKKDKILTVTSINTTLQYLSDCLHS